MKCNEIRELLSLYIDNMLEDELKSEVEKHIAFCPECKKEYEELKELSQILSDLPEVPLPENFDQRIHDALVASKKADNPAVIPMKKQSKMKKAVKYMSTVAAIFVVGIFSIAMYNNSDQLIPKDYACSYFPGNVAMDDAACDSAPAPAEIDMDLYADSNQDAGGAMQQENSEFNYNVGGEERITESKNDANAPEADMTAGADTDAAESEKKIEGLLPSRGEINMPPLDRFLLDYRVTHGAIGDARDTVALRYYMGSLERELGDKEFTILSCQKGEDSIWTFEVEIVSTDDNNNEVKEIVIYKAQDGTLWIED